MPYQVFPHRMRLIDQVLRQGLPGSSWDRRPTISFAMRGDTGHENDGGVRCRDLYPKHRTLSSHAQEQSSMQDAGGRIREFGNRAKISQWLMVWFTFF